MALPVPRPLVLDSGAISALAGDDVRAWAVLVNRREKGALVLTSAAVVAEVVTGRRQDAKANRVLNGITIANVAEELARRAGALRYRARLPATVDALVVATAEAAGGDAAGAVVLTGDLVDIGALAGVAKRVTVKTW